MYAVRSKAGRIVQRFATRAAAERFVRGARTAASPKANHPRTGASDREYAKGVLYLSVQPNAQSMTFSASDLASRVGVRRDQAEDEIANLLREGLIADTGGEHYRPTPSGWIWIAGRDKSLRHLLPQRSPTRGFLPARKRSTERLSIDGWKVRYYDPRLGTHEFVVTTHHELAKAKEWLNEGGYMYTITPMRNGVQVGPQGSPKRLTADVLPYVGYGIQTVGEYKATLAFLRAVLAAEERRAPPSYALDASIGSNEYMGAMAALRGGLVRQSGHDQTGPLRLTPLGREYLSQRQSAKSP